MCGIAGLWRVGDTVRDDGIAACARRMADRLRHRGPDDAGVWADSDTGLALSHRRLSIVDLSPQGHQPMVSADDRYVIVFNGEIYNFAELRAEIEPCGYPFKGHSDTEVLLAAIGCWGLSATLDRLNGMFAIALWDRAERRLSLARDRIGQKPLFFGWTRSGFVFASELRALNSLPDFEARIDSTAIQRYLQLGHVPCPNSIYEGIYKLPAGHFITLDARDARRPQDPMAIAVAYWSMADVAQRAAAQRTDWTDAQAVQALDEALHRATHYRMVSEVPLGAFLSGGIDSSLVLAIMQQQSAQPVHSYALGFGAHGKGETEYARAIAEHLGTRHTELHITDQEAIDTVPRMPEIVDEPSADFAQVPNYLIAKQARPHIKVALTGDGGDEFFCGYSRFHRVPRRWRKLARVPHRLRRMSAAVQERLPRGRRHPISIARRRAGSLDELYYYEFCHWLYDSPLLADGRIERGAYYVATAQWPGLADPIERLLLADQTTHLPDVILAKVDRTSMACGLEVRSPLLDFNVAELSWRLPMRMKYRDGQGKWLMRELLAQYMPRALYERPKQGFGAPIGQWLAGPLKEWASDLLSRERLSRQGLLDPELVQQAWRAQHTDQRAWQKQIWALLMLQAWMTEHTQSP